MIVSKYNAPHFVTFEITQHCCQASGLQGLMISNVLKQGTAFILENQPVCELHHEYLDT
jgi:hypothetical protein